jgi:hypothetical protein
LSAVIIPVDSPAVAVRSFVTGKEKATVIVFLVVDNKGKPPDVPHHLILVSQNQVEVALKSESS